MLLPGETETAGGLWNIQVQCTPYEYGVHLSRDPKGQYLLRESVLRTD